MRNRFFLFQFKKKTLNYLETPDLKEGIEVIAFPKIKECISYVPS